MRTPSAVRLILLAAAVLPLAAAAPPASPPSAVPAAPAQLAAVLDEYWKFRLEDDPGSRLALGLPVTRLPDVSEERSQQSAAVARRLLERLERIDGAALSHEDWLSKEIAAWECRQAAYGVKRLDAVLEGSTFTFGMYEVPTTVEPMGFYRFNGSKLSERPQINAAALIYHELVPGHHFQINLQRENESLPAFRRLNDHTAYVEGWGEYASDLASEMGLYGDPYDEYGRLGMDIFLSSRLVVDTGMNLLGWPRAKAIEYMLAHDLESETQITSETLRYSAAMPAQALAYKMGSAKIRELRRHAEKALGSRFDIRRFHDAVLGSGSMPLTVLEKHVEWWIGEERKR
jgi:uncharacterized protein (DUF885 family)